MEIESNLLLEMEHSVNNLKGNQTSCADHEYSLYFGYSTLLILHCTASQWHKYRLFEAVT